MGQNQCEFQPYHGAVYPNYSNSQMNVAFNAFLDGNIEPLIAQINEEQYNHLYLYPQNGSPLPLEYNKLGYLMQLFSQIPSVTYLTIHANLTLGQATQFAHSLADSNVCHFYLDSPFLSKPGIQEYINALSDTKVSNFSLSNNELNDKIVDSMTFIGTTFSVLDLFNVDVTEYGFTKIIQSTYGSNINDLIIDCDTYLSSTVFDDIDFSKTNITSIYFGDFYFEEGALAHLNLNGSQVEEFFLHDNSLTANNLGDLSQSLQESNVNYLSICQTYKETLDLSQFHLQGTTVETLDLHAYFNVDDLAELDLAGTQIKTLDLSYNNLTDEHLKYLNLKESNIEHLNLDYNNAITENGIETVKEIIKDTHVMDVALSTYINGVNKEFVLYNEHVLPAEDLTPMTFSENPLGAFEQEIYQGL